MPATTAAQGRCLDVLLEALPRVRKRTESGMNVAQDGKKSTRVENLVAQSESDAIVADAREQLAILRQTRRRLLPDTDDAEVLSELVVVDGKIRQCEAELGLMSAAPTTIPLRRSDTAFGAGRAQTEYTPAAK